MRNHHHTAGKFQQCVFQRAQGFYVEVVRRFVQQQHIAAAQQSFCQVQTATFAARQLTCDFALVTAFEVEASQILACGDFKLTNLQNVTAFGNVVEHGFIILQTFAALVNQAHFHGLPDFHFAGIRLLFARNHFEQRRFTRAVRADDADNRASRHFEAQIINQHFIAKRLGNIHKFNYFVTQTLGDRNEDFLRFIAFLVFIVAHFFKTSQTRFRLGLAAFGILAHPFQFLLHRLHARGFGFCLVFQAFFFLLQPRRIIAFPRNTVAAVKFQNPFGGVVQEIAVVCYRNDCAGETYQELLQPFDRFRVQVVGRLIKQKHIRLAQQEFAQSDATFFTAGQVADFCIPFRQAQRIGSDFQFMLCTAAGRRTRRNNCFQTALLFRQRVKIRIRIGILGIHFFQAFLRGSHFAQTAFHFLAHGFFRIKLRLLRQIADFNAAHRHGFALKFFIHARHNPQYSRFTRTVQTEQTDFCTGEK